MAAAVLEDRIINDIVGRASDPEGFARFQAQGKACGWCRRPIRLVGHVDELDPDRHRRRRRYSTLDEPDGVFLKACGTRRTTRCPACARVYQQDARQLIAAGLNGGKGVPESVSTHPAFFATLTAPSFGAVHGRPRSGRPHPCHPGPAKRRCVHGRPTVCWKRHRPDDPALGEPLCPDCYDYPGAVLWNASVGELWRRTTIYLQRMVAKLTGTTPMDLGRRLRISYAKVVEYQRRGVVHVHVVIRLDGPSGPDSEPADGINAETVALAFRLAAGQVAVRLPECAGMARWGTELDVRLIAHGPDTVGSGAVANYIAKYACKSAHESGALDRRFRRYAEITQRDLPLHHRALVDTAWSLGGRPPGVELKLRYWAHDLGHRGHWLTKSRRWSTTLGALRAARRQWTEQQRRRGETETNDIGTLADLVATWQFSGIGWTTPGDAYLAERFRQEAEAARLFAREQRLELERVS